MPPLNDQLLPAVAPPMSDAEVSSMLTWSVDQVCTWLHSVGLDVFEKHFREHSITGDILVMHIRFHCLCCHFFCHCPQPLAVASASATAADAEVLQYALCAQPLITLAELKDMDIGLVGPRTQLLRKISKLKRAYVNYQRNRPLWSGLEERYTNPCECVSDYLFSCCFPDPPDKYALTSSHVKLTHKVYPMGKMLKCCAKGTNMNSIDLSLVVDVDFASNQTCCGGRDTVIVQHEKDADSAMLYVTLGEGPNVSRMIRDAVEENQANEKLNPLAAA